MVHTRHATFQLFLKVKRFSAIVIVSKFKCTTTGDYPFASTDVDCIMLTMSAQKKTGRPVA